MEEKQRMRTYITSAIQGLFSHSNGIKVIIEFHMPIPVSWSKKRQIMAKGKPHTSRPDLDNLIKFVGDALNDVLWVDDSLIYELHVRKSYHGEPKTRIKVCALDEKPIPTLLSQ
jgi:Holliday junction resolvase RusA-like endonuclease